MTGFGASLQNVCGAASSSLGSVRPFAALVTNGRNGPFLTVMVERSGPISAPSKLRREGRRPDFRCGTHQQPLSGQSYCSPQVHDDTRFQTDSVTGGAERSFAWSWTKSINLAKSGRLWVSSGASVAVCMSPLTIGRVGGGIAKPHHHKLPLWNYTQHS
jgi:hypothetical protein